MMHTTNCNCRTTCSTSWSSDSTYLEQLSGQLLRTSLNGKRLAEQSLRSSWLILIRLCLSVSPTSICVSSKRPHGILARRCTSVGRLCAIELTRAMLHQSKRQTIQVELELLPRQRKERR